MTVSSEVRCKCKQLLTHYFRDILSTHASEAEHSSFLLFSHRYFSAHSFKRLEKEVRILFCHVIVIQFTTMTIIVDSFTTLQFAINRHRTEKLYLLSLFDQLVHSRYVCRFWLSSHWPFSHYANRAPSIVWQLLSQFNT